MKSYMVAACFICASVFSAGALHAQDDQTTGATGGVDCSPDAAGNVPAECLPLLDPAAGPAPTGTPAADGSPSVPGLGADDDEGTILPGTDEGAST